MTRVQDPARHLVDPRSLAVVVQWQAAEKRQRGERQHTGSVDKWEPLILFFPIIPLFWSEWKHCIKLFLVQ